MTRQPAYEVLQYSVENFIKVLARKASFSVEQFKAELRGVYFDEYLSELGPQTIVVENDYVDQHYLDDYAGYYVSCFRDYGKTCVRIHFFASRFTKSTFAKILSGQNSSTQLQENYLGFMVVKPLPHTVIGRTCLKTYQENPRFYPITRRYVANLFGIELSVNSLAFQEQDRAAAACSSSALWSIFQGSGQLFHHEIPSPFEITAAATAVSPPQVEIAASIELQTRSLPSRGLSLFQMAQAVRTVGLEPYSVQVRHKFLLTSTAYSYMRAKIPVLLMIDLYKVQSNQFMGKHAVALVGYRLQELQVVDPLTDFVLLSNRIEQIYTHDDQVGPFARMRFLDNGLLSTSYGGPGMYVAHPQALLVPLLPTIRIPLGTICDLVRELDQFMEQARLTGAFEVDADRLEWDIYLSSIQDFKTQIFSMQSLAVEQRTRILTKSFPIYIWAAKAYVNQEPVLELIFDSTDLEQGQLVLAVISHSKTFVKTFQTAAKSILSFATEELGARLLATIQYILENAE